MSGDWLISQPFEYANEEEAEWQFHDRDGQTHREDLIGWEANNRSGVKGRLLEVVHGYAGGKKGRPRTLIVFEWRLLPGGGENRIKNVEIIVAFQATGDRAGVQSGASIADFDPVPVAWAPKKIVLSHFSQAPVLEAAGTDYGAQIGYSSYASLTANRHRSSSQTVERINHRLMAGSPTYVGKNSGTRNGMKWELSENAQLKSGVQYEVCTAVLLRRQAYDLGKFNVVVAAQANDTATRRLLRTLGRILGVWSLDGPAAFDPTVVPGSSDGETGEDDVAARKTTRDWENLDKVNLENVLIKDWGLGSAEELADKAAAAAADGVPTEAEEGTG